MVFRHQSKSHVPQPVSLHGFLTLGILYVVGQGGIGVVFSGVFRGGLRGLRHPPPTQE